MAGKRITFTTRLTSARVYGGTVKGPVAQYVATYLQIEVAAVTTGDLAVAVLHHHGMGPFLVAIASLLDEKARKSKNLPRLFAQLINNGLLPSEVTRAQATTSTLTDRERRPIILAHTFEEVQVLGEMYRRAFYVGWHDGVELHVHETARNILLDYWAGIAEYVDAKPGATVRDLFEHMIRLVEQAYPDMLNHARATLERFLEEGGDEGTTLSSGSEVDQ